MARRSTSVALLLCALLGAGALGVARADVIFLEDGGKLRGTILEETSRAVTIETAVGKVKVSRGDISRILREEDARAEFERRWSELEPRDDADDFYELAVWARGKRLMAEAKRSLEKTISLDAYHRQAREALGHRYHQGRWYSAEDYKQVVQGLVRWGDRWVTAADKEKLEQGLVQDEEGRWSVPPREGEPEDEAGSPRAKASQGPKEADKGAPVAPRPRAGAVPKPPVAGEDTDWYRDNTRIGDFASAPEVVSRHYTIKTNIRPEHAKRYGVMMDRYYVRFLKVFREFLPGGDLPKSTIWIYSDRQEFMAQERMGPTTGGFYNTGTKRVTAYHGLFGQTGTTREVLAHEGTHQFQDLVLGGNFRNCPIWILEGLAVLFESAYYDGEQVVIGLVPRDRLAGLKRGIETNTLIPLTQLIRTPQHQFTGYHYAHAWGLIYMILYYGDSKPVRQRTQQWFSDLFSASKTGRVTPEMVEERCGGREKFLELEERWKAWIRDLPYDFDPRGR